MSFLLYIIFKRLWTLSATFSNWSSGVEYVYYSNLYIHIFMFTFSRDWKQHNLLELSATFLSLNINFMQYINFTNHKNKLLTITNLPIHISCALQIFCIKLFIQCMINPKNHKQKISNKNWAYELELIKLQTAFSTTLLTTNKYIAANTASPQQEADSKWLARTLL